MLTCNNRTTQFGKHCTHDPGSGSNLGHGLDFSPVQLPVGTAVVKHEVPVVPGFGRLDMGPPGVAAKVVGRDCRDRAASAAI